MRTHPGGTVTFLFTDIKGLASMHTNQARPEQTAQLFVCTDVAREKIGDPRPPVEQGSVEKIWQPSIPN